MLSTKKERYRIIIVIVLCGVMALCAGCGDSLERDKDRAIRSDSVEWTVVKSPVTGKYYEIAKGGGTLTGFMGMSEISEEEFSSATGKREE